MSIVGGKGAIRAESEEMQVDVTMETSSSSNTCTTEQVHVQIEMPPPGPTPALRSHTKVTSVSSGDVSVNSGSIKGSESSGSWATNSGSKSNSSRARSMTPKRILHGQQPIHGDIVQEPSTSEKSTPRACASSDSLNELPHRHNKIPFCCVDYKKQKKVSPVQGNHGKHPKVKHSVDCRLRKSSEKQSVNRSDSSTSVDCVPGRSQARLCSRLDEQTGFEPQRNIIPKRQQQGQQQSELCSDKGETSRTFCVPRAAQSRLCLGSATLSVENMEAQSSFEGNLGLRSVTVGYPYLSDSALYRPSPMRDPTAPRSEYKVKRTKKGKGKKTKDKYLIFTKGSETYTPHQIGIKRIKPLQAFSKDGSRLLPNVMDTTYNAEQGEINDEVDHLIDMHGHIIGMTLSPDQR